MPFGLTNTQAIFQHLMKNCMEDLHLNYCLFYLHDIIIFSSMSEEYILQLEAVFEKLMPAGLKLSPSKCHLFKKPIKYLGHIISEDGIEVDPDKISCVKDWLVPKTVLEVKHFVGFTSFYRRLVKDFAKIARPLHLVTQGGIHGLHQTLYFTYRCKYRRNWCSSTSGGQWGERVIAYASWGLSKSERNYPIHKLDFLALKWAITKKFHNYQTKNKMKVPYPPLEWGPEQQKEFTGVYSEHR